MFMTKQKSAWLTGVALVALELVCFAKTPTLSGKVVAYDPLAHAAKSATFAANKEVLILDAAGKKKRYIKLTFLSFGTTQVDPKYFTGSEPLSVKALRDKTCDERYPSFVTQVTLDQKTGTYLLTDAFKNSPPTKIKTIECYDATQKK